MKAPSKLLVLFLYSSNLAFFTKSRLKVSLSLARKPWSARQLVRIYLLS
jgi:hypothetical protein